MFSEVADAGECCNGQCNCILYPFSQTCIENVNVQIEGVKETSLHKVQLAAPVTQHLFVCQVSLSFSVCIFFHFKKSVSTSAIYGVLLALSQLLYLSNGSGSGSSRTAMRQMCAADDLRPPPPPSPLRDLLHTVHCRWHDFSFGCTTLVLVQYFLTSLSVGERELWKLSLCV